MEAKVTVTTRCNAKCITCPAHTLEEQTMSYGFFKNVINRLLDSPLISSIFINSIGDLYTIDNHIVYLYFLESKKGRKPISITTNGSLLDYIPDVDCFVISFNAGKKETYEKITGLNFEQTVTNIRQAIKETKCKHIEIHHLSFEDNRGEEKDFYNLFADLPVKLRISYKYDNQFGQDKSLLKANRIYCDYLDKIVIAPDGKIVMCSHDFFFETDLGCIEKGVADSVFCRARETKKKEHRELVFTGLCEKCNYNTSVEGRIFYIK